MSSLVSRHAGQQHAVTEVTSEDRRLRPNVIDLTSLLARHSQAEPMCPLSHAVYVCVCVHVTDFTGAGHTSRRHHLHGAGIWRHRPCTPSG